MFGWHARTCLLSMHLRCGERMLKARVPCVPSCSCAGGLMSGALFQYPGAVIMTAVGVGAANTLGDPALWLRSLTAGVSAGERSNAPAWGTWVCTWYGYGYGPGTC